MAPRRKQTIGLLSVALACAIGAAGAGERVSQRWTDINYAPCENIGLTATGSVTASALIGRGGSSDRLEEFSLTLRYNHAFTPSGSVSWTDSSGERRSTRLNAPWFSIAAPSDVKLLVTPRVMTGAWSGPHEAMAIEKLSGSPVSLQVSVLFSAPEGACTASFSADWNP